MTNIRNKSVLVISDDVRTVRALDILLTREGAAVTWAAWAGDATGILTGRPAPVDLVIVDLRIPFVAGMSAVRTVHKAVPELPIMVLTAFGGPDVRAKCIRQGATAFLEKPLKTQSLLEAMNKVFTSELTSAQEIAPDRLPAPGQFGTENSGDEIVQSKKGVIVYEQNK